MSDQRLVDYIKNQLELGINKEEIKKALLEKGWQENEIDEVFSSLSSSPDASGLDEQSNNQSEKKEPSSSEHEVEKISRKNQKIFFWIIATVVLLFISAGFFWFFFYFNSPQRVLGKMVTSLGEIKSAKYNGKIQAEVGTRKNSFNSSNSQIEAFLPNLKNNNERSILTIDFDVKADFQDRENQKFTSKVSGSLKNQGMDDISTVLDMVMADDVLYFKIEDFSDSKNVPFLDMYKDQWVEINYKELGGDFNKGEEKSEESNNLWTEELTSEQKKEIRKIISKSSPIKSIQTLPDEEIDGQKTFHYKLKIKGSDFIDTILEINEVAEERKMTEEEKEEMKDFFSQMANLEMECWIGKRDFLPHKFLVTLELGENEEIDYYGKFSTEFNFSNFNEDFDIEAPEEVKTLEELNQEIQDKMFQSYPENFQEDMLKDSDYDGLADFLEEAYGTDSQNPDTDGDGYSDLEEIQNGYDPKGPGNLILESSSSGVL